MKNGRVAVHLCGNAQTPTHGKNLAGNALSYFFITPKQKTHCTGKEPKCWRQCESQDANHWHIFWDCPIIAQFWKDVHKNMESVFNVILPFEFTTLVMGK